MKFIHLVPVLAISAALGASGAGAGHGAARSEQAVARLTPPWLSEDGQAEALEEDDPHAGMPADEVHAQVLGLPAPAAGEADAENAAAPVERSQAPNGKTVAEVFAARRALDQTRVTVRGTVVKLTEGVLGKTYMHLRDGTGTAEGGDDDLTVTTVEAISLGETVEVEGRLAIDQDVGVGYSYPALLADASRVRR